MAEFNQDSPAQSEARWGMYATALHRGTSASEAEQLASIAVKVTAPDAGSQQSPTPPQVARLDRALAVLPLLVLAIVLVLLLAGCSADPNQASRNSIQAQRDRQYSQMATADVAPTMPAPVATQPAATTAVIDSQPCPNGVVPAKLPPRRADLAPQCGEPGGPEGECWPTPEYLPATCPCATSAEIDAALQSNEPWICPSNGGAQ